MTTREMTRQIASSLSDKAYSEEFVAAEIATTIPFQIRAMRKERNWTQAELAAKAETHQETISDFENPNRGPQKIETLRRIAAAFDVALIVRFAPFSELVDWSANMSKTNHFVPSRTQDTKLRAQQSGKREPKGASTTLAQRRFDFGGTTTSIADWKARHADQRVINDDVLTSDNRMNRVAQAI